LVNVLRTALVVVVVARVVVVVVVTGRVVVVVVVVTGRVVVVVVVTGRLVVVEVVEVVEVAGDAEPVQAVPFNVKPVGVPAVGTLVPWKPKEAVPLVGTEPFHPAFAALTAVPDWVTEAFQAEETASPAVKVQASVQPLSASPRFVTVTLATNPPDHCEATV
jgi:hypothetical protein